MHAKIAPWWWCPWRAWTKPMCNLGPAFGTKDWATTYNAGVPYQSALLLVQFSVNLLRKAAEDGTSTWGPCHSHGRPTWSPRFLVSALTSLGPCGHLGNDPENERSISLSFQLCKYMKRKHATELEGHSQNLGPIGILQKSKLHLRCVQSTPPHQKKTT